MRSVDKTLGHEDIIYYESVLKNRNLVKDFQDKLSLDLSFFQGVKYQIESVLRVWDAVLGEKIRYDTEGRLPVNRQFMESVLLCLHTIPKKIKIGYLAPSALKSTVTMRRLPTILSDGEESYENNQSSPRSESSMSSGLSLGIKYQDPEQISQHEDILSMSTSEYEPPTQFDESYHSYRGASSQTPLLESQDGNTEPWDRNTVTVDPRVFLPENITYPPLDNGAGTENPGPASSVDLSQTICGGQERLHIPQLQRGDNGSQESHAQASSRRISIPKKGKSKERDSVPQAKFDGRVKKQTYRKRKPE
ncbi:hypothetical protein F5X99DRAFT_404337 [Biscogniauxia marginata]|nr:hypothetical protein F5X99DRAFT_404337 [Biscogniauxia marginata]